MVKTHATCFYCVDKERHTMQAPNYFHPEVLPAFKDPSADLHAIRSNYVVFISPIWFILILFNSHFCRMQTADIQPSHHDTLTTGIKWLAATVLHYY